MISLVEHEDASLDRAADLLMHCLILYRLPGLMQISDENDEKYTDI